MKLLPGLLLALVCRAATAEDGDCWSEVSKQVHPEGTTGFYQCTQYTCTNGNWEATGITDPDCDIFADGCWSPTIHKVVAYGVKGYYKCDQVECKPDKTWKPTGERLPNCPAGSVACFNWMTNETVPVDSTMYFECNQYLCTEEYDWVQNGERDPSCETNGCFSVVTQEVVPYGVKGWWKCEQMECMTDKTWKKTGEQLPGCSEGNILCWNWMKLEAVPVGSMMNYKHYSYKCTENDWEQTGPINEREGSPVPPATPQIGVMPLGVNVNQQTVENKAEAECHIEEGSMDRWRKKCNWCRCVNGKGFCTRKGCLPAINERLENEPECEGTIMFKKDCNWCSCVDGRAICTFRACLPGSSSMTPGHTATPMSAMVHRTSAQPPGSQRFKGEILCTPGSVWRNKCNRCRCVDGKGVCTKMACPPGPDTSDSPVCEGESSWKIKCNWCNCTNGQAVCQRRVCASRPFSPRDPDFASVINRETECTEGSNWRRNCNWCRCVKGKQICTRRVCITAISDDKPECVGEARWKEDCNWCSCRNSKALCTLKACLPAWTSRTAIGVIKEDEPECSEGSKWMKSCNRCLCRNGKATCTKKACPPPQILAASDQPECEGSSQWRKDCNLCHCIEGRAICTLRACAPDVRSPPSTSDEECLDGSSWKNECNSCSCMNGRAACTMMACLPGFKPSADEEECSPGAFWRKDCNSCRCVNGKGVCTRRACIPVPKSAAIKICSLPAIAPEAKVCGGFMRKWTYNSEASECQQIVYGGCGGTENLFSTIEECQNACKSPHGVSLFRSGINRQEICKLPIKVGPCFASKAKYAFNHTSNRCERFYYGGCQGNANNFNSAQECFDECGGEPPVSYAGCERSKCQWSRWSHYRAKGCLPQYDNGACCPTSFTCPYQAPSDSDICNYRGKDYVIGDKVPVAEDCVASCHCSPGAPGSGAEIRCANIECPDLFRPPEPNCRQLYRMGQCCSYSKDCQDPASPPQQLDSELVTCKWSNKSYQEGDRMYFDGEYNCQMCVCSRDFSGPTGAGCELITCGLDFRYSSKFQKGCTPIYFEDKCCPIDWMCPGDSRVVSQLQGTATRSDSMKCMMGDKSLELGATLTMNERNCEIKCNCLTPPEFTCIRHRNCDLAQESQTQPIISVRRGNLDCPPVTCNEGCTTLTDLRTGCHFCSCGDDVVTCPEQSCHESCHKVQDTKSGCPRCECKCPKDPLGNPPCPMDCAVHFVKDPATGCEKCECNPSLIGGSNLPPHREDCPTNPMTGRAHCPMDCAVLYQTNEETGCEECICDPNNSNSPFPHPFHPVPIPARPNN